MGNRRVCAALSISCRPAPTDQPISSRAQWWWDHPASLPTSGRRRARCQTYKTALNNPVHTHHTFTKEAPAVKPTLQADDEAAPAEGSRCRTCHQQQLFRPGKGHGSKHPSRIKVPSPQTRKLRAAAQATFFPPLLSFFLGLNWTFPQQSCFAAQGSVARCHWSEPLNFI